MAKIYARRIREGRMTIDQVPARWRAEVLAILGGDGGEPEGMPDLAGMTKAELLSYAQGHGVTAYESWTKDRIIEAIRAALAA